MTRAPVQLEYGRADTQETPGLGWRVTMVSVGWFVSTAAFLSSLLALIFLQPARVATDGLAQVLLFVLPIPALIGMVALLVSPYREAGRSIGVWIACVALAAIALLWAAFTAIYYNNVGWPQGMRNLLLLQAARTIAGVAVPSIALVAVLLCTTRRAWLALIWLAIATTLSSVTLVVVEFVLQQTHNLNGWGAGGIVPLFRAIPGSITLALIAWAVMRPAGWTYWLLRVSGAVAIVLAIAGGALVFIEVATQLGEPSAVAAYASNVLFLDVGTTVIPMLPMLLWPKLPAPWRN